MKVFPMSLDITKEDGTLVYSLKGKLVLSQMAVNPREFIAEDALYQDIFEAVEGNFKGEDLYHEDEAGTRWVYDGRRYYVAS